MRYSCIWPDCFGLKQHVAKECGYSQRYTHQFQRDHFYTSGACHYVLSKNSLDADIRYVIETSDDVVQTSQVCNSGDERQCTSMLLRYGHRIQT
jgi:hypothetical protein